jgi:hypothetical protein
VRLGGFIQVEGAGQVSCDSRPLSDSRQQERFISEYFNYNIESRSVSGLGIAMKSHGELLQ